jgi:hypothetical protein
VVVNDVNGKWRDAYYYDRYDRPRNGHAVQRPTADAAAG